MEMDCEGCAGCCVDWRPLAPDADFDHERRGRYRPVDDTYNLAVLTRGDVRSFLEAGLGDVMTPRLFYAGEGREDGDGREREDGGRASSEDGNDDEDGHREGGRITVDGHAVAAVDGRPAFFVGLRKSPKPVAPFGSDPAWLPTCAFLDPTTLQCRIHDAPLYPQDCADYPGHDLLLGAETECERVEAVHGGQRLLDDAAPEDAPGLLLGPQALGEKVFAYPDPAELSGVVERLAAGDARPADRARFVAVAAASSPGTVAVDETRRESAREAAMAADSWAGRAVAEWEERAGSEPPDPASARRVEVERGAPTTPGWARPGSGDAADSEGADGAAGPES